MKLKIENTYFKFGFTFFISVSACIVLFFMLYRSEGLLEGMSSFNAILTPFVYGFVLAYLLTPMFNFSVRIFNKMLEALPYKKKFFCRVSKFMATLISMIITIAFVAGLISMVLPQLITSIIKIIDTFPSNADGLMTWLIDNFNLSNEVAKFINNNVVKTLTDWIVENLVPTMSEVVEGVSTGVLSVLVVLKNILIGMIICIYFLNSKETFAAQGKKFIYANWKKENASLIIEETKFIHKTFSSFINGKIIDSMIVGLICFVVLSIMGMPYNLLISVIIGITNIIPFFGPFIGAIPSTIIILLESPVQAMYFVIFILILQQLDGNVIGPKILGDSTGIPSFWVIFAILLGGGLFGFAGMIVGIPIFAIMYSYMSRYTKHKLLKKGLSPYTKDYRDMSNFENTEKKD